MTDEYSLLAPVPKRGPHARPAIIIQARMGSTRLPGKVLMPINGIPMLQGMVQRLLSLKTPLILATSTVQNDDVIEDLGKKLGVSVFRGSEEDVLDRYYKAASMASPDAVVRLTGDCPLTDPEMVDKALDLFYHLHTDLLSNALRRTYPRGFDIEIFTIEALKQSAAEASLPKDREHVTLYIKNHPEKFRLSSFVADEDLSAWRLTVDTKEDFELVSKVLTHLQGNVSFEATKQLLLRHPQWQEINKAIQQKEV